VEKLRGWWRESVSGEVEKSRGKEDEKEKEEEKEEAENGVVTRSRSGKKEEEM
jgi:hypothetical protein